MSKLLRMTEEKLEESQKEREKADFSCITAQQLRFCRYFLAHGYHPAESAQFAGYRTKNYANVGRSVLCQPGVKYFIRSEMAKMNEELKIDFEWKMRKLKLAVDYSIPENEPITDDDYSRMNLRAGISAISEMNKMQGDYAPVKMDNTHRVDEEKIEEIRKELERPY